MKETRPNSYTLPDFIYVILQEKKGHENAGWIITKGWIEEKSLVVTKQEEGELCNDKNVLIRDGSYITICKKINFTPYFND